MRMLKFTAVDLDDRTGVPKQNFRGGFHDARLSGPCGPQKQEAPYRAPRRVQAGTENLEQVDHRLHRFLLPDDLRAQRLTKLRRLAATQSRIENHRLSAHVSLLTNASLGNYCGERALIGFHSEIVEMVNAGSLPHN